MPHPLLPLSLVVATALAVPTTASAGCHLVDCVENVYITPKDIQARSCEDLWILRNSIWNDAGYCFKTPRAIKAFGNHACQYTDQSAVPLNDYQRANARTILAVESAHNCVAN
ncbi:YARHG domain-containing protein [Hyphomicrobium sp.]|uniref:YARHG domain-containing protein n=1 Tax=Hyphomicrobium sp. TaxID=82 RepID=UPI0025BA82D0|nr:YARHG domain-containing protein [Hyphomicrobium sp.]MCC7252540.1 YARHG domain-containing protein [Hyphomicrobium sp.]